MLDNNQDDQLTSLKNELLIVRSELHNLQNSRSVRIAKFAKQLLNAKPTEWLSILKNSPSLFKRFDSPRLEKLVDKNSIFSSVNNPLPLYCFPNVNVAFVGVEIEKLFQFSCNTFSLGDETHRALLSYDAVQMIAVDIREYQPDLHNELISDALSKKVKLVYFYDNKDKARSFIKTFGNNGQGFCINPSEPESIRNYIDIYSITPHIPEIAGITSIYKTSSLDKYNKKTIPTNKLSKESLENIKTGDIIIIDENDLLSIDSSSQKSIKKITTLIATGIPVVVYGKRPNWLSDSVACFDNRDELDEFIKNMSLPYALERYSTLCRRSTIFEFNAMKCVSDILIRIGLINELKDPTISVLLATKRPQYIKHALSQLEKQTIRPYEVVILPHGISDKENEKIMTIINKSSLNIKHKRYDSDMLFGQVLNSGLDQATGEFVTKIDDDDYYLPNHLLDLYVASLHSRADIVGKWNNWVYIKNEDRVINWVPEMSESYVRHLPGGTFFVRTSLLKNLRFGYVRRAIDSELYKRAISRGATLYSTHRYNYVRVRDNDHTYKTTDADFKSRAHPSSVNGLLIDELSV